MKHRYGQHAPERLPSRPIAKMMCNPIYTSIEVHPDLTQDRPRGSYDAARFLEIANLNFKNHGSDQCLRTFMKALREPTEWTRLVPIHPTFSLRRKAEISEEDFIQGGKLLIKGYGINKYFQNVIENLAQGTIMPLEEEAV